MIDEHAIKCSFKEEQPYTLKDGIIWDLFIINVQINTW